MREARTSEEFKNKQEQGHGGLDEVRNQQEWDRQR